MIASSYPLLDAFLTMLWVFLFIIWVWLLVVVFGDIFRSHDLSGPGKAGWTLGVILVPWLGILVYLIVRGPSMAERQVAEVKAREAAVRAAITESLPPVSVADELTKLVDLHTLGILSDDEFAEQKAKVLGNAPPLALGTIQVPPAGSQSPESPPEPLV
jgi:Phospholipase_D-nuclease N-terminal